MSSNIPFSSDLKFHLDGFKQRVPVDHCQPSLLFLKYLTNRGAGGRGPSPNSNWGF